MGRPPPRGARCGAVAGRNDPLPPDGVGRPPRDSPTRALRRRERGNPRGRPPRSEPRRGAAEARDPARPARRAPARRRPAQDGARLRRASRRDDGRVRHAALPRRISRTLSPSRRRRRGLAGAPGLAGSVAHDRGLPVPRVGRAPGERPRRRGADGHAARRPRGGPVASVAEARGRATRRSGLAAAARGSRRPRPGAPPRSRADPGAARGAGPGAPRPAIPFRCDPLGPPHRRRPPRAGGTQRCVCACGRRGARRPRRRDSLEPAGLLSRRGADPPVPGLAEGRPAGSVLRRLVRPFAKPLLG